MECIPDYHLNQLFHILCLHHKGKLVGLECALLKILPVAFSTSGTMKVCLVKLAARADFPLLLTAVDSESHSFGAFGAGILIIEDSILACWGNTKQETKQTNKFKHLRFLSLTPTVLPLQTLQNLYDTGQTTSVFIPPTITDTHDPC